jgi:putative hydrolase of the HAD superfamily
MMSNRIALEKIALVTFDLDDTLYPERRYVIGGLKNVADSLLPEDRIAADALYEKMLVLHREGRRDIFQRILADLGRDCSNDQITRLLECYRLSNRPLDLFADAEAAMERFRDAGLHLAILTDGDFLAQQKKVELLNLKSRVEEIVYTDRFGRDHWKPSPHGFELLMSRFQLAPEQCLYIADNEAKDFAGPNRLGWRSVKILRPDGVYLNKIAEEPFFKPEFTLTTLDDLEITPS